MVLMSDHLYLLRLIEDGGGLLLNSKIKGLGRGMDMKLGELRRNGYVNAGDHPTIMVGTVKATALSLTGKGKGALERLREHA